MPKEVGHMIKRWQKRRHVYNDDNPFECPCQPVIEEETDKEIIVRHNDLVWEEIEVVQ